MLLALSILALANSLGPSTSLLAPITRLISNVLYFAWVGVYCLVTGTAAVTGQFWVLDALGGRGGQVCGNKFLDCRPWD